MKYTSLESEINSALADALTKEGINLVNIPRWPGTFYLAHAVVPAVRRWLDCHIKESKILQAVEAAKSLPNATAEYVQAAEQIVTLVKSTYNEGPANFRDGWNAAVAFIEHERAKSGNAQGTGSQAQAPST